MVPKGVGRWTPPQKSFGNILFDMVPKDTKLDIFLAPGFGNILFDMVPKGGALCIETKKSSYEIILISKSL